MPGLGTRDHEATGALVTPYRAMDVRFNLDEVVGVEPPFTLRRFGRQIVLDESNVLLQPRPDVELLASGYWSLRPRQEDLHRIHEQTDAGGSVMLLSEFNAIAHVKQEPLWRTPSEITGLTTGSDPDLAGSNNDLFFTLRRPAGSSWDLSVISGIPKPAFETENLLMDLVMEGNTSEPEDQGFLFRFHAAGTNRHAPDNLLCFTFGGPLFGSGYGRYALTFRGNGTCQLSELVSGAWQNRREWAYTTPHQVMNAAHTCRVIPHARRYLEFKSETNRLAEPIVYQQQRGNVSPYVAPTGSPTVSLYTVSPEVTGQPAVHSRFVTGMGPVRVYVRRDLRMWWQVSRLTYPTSGSVVDMPFVVPFGLGDAQPLKINTEAFVAFETVGEVEEPLTTVETFPYDAEDQVLLDDHDGGVGFVLPAARDPAPDPLHTENKVRVRIQLNSLFQDRSPYVAGYTAYRAGSQQTIVPGILGGGSLVDCRITGPTSDPTHDLASLSIEDETNELTQLRQRGGQSVEVRTTYDAEGTNKATLFRGRVGRAEARRAGWDEGQEYPDPEWRRYEIQCIGEWQRLQEQVIFGQRYFDRDETAPKKPDGSYPAWKITDIIKQVIRDCGYPDSQMDVPDLDTRIPSDVEPTQIAVPIPFTGSGDFIQRLARDYLGHWLLFDPNAVNGGFRGIWRLRPAPRIAAGSGPLWSFTNAEPAPASGVTLTFRSEAYGSSTSPIARGSFRSWISPPEANAVFVTATGAFLPDKAQTSLSQWLINYRSYNPPGGPGLADPGPDNPDYLGRLIPLFVTDPQASGGLSGEKGQAIVNAVCRRLFNFACRAEQRVAWEAELVLVADPADTLLDGKRPLRRGDHVEVDGVDCILDTCDPGFDTDMYQAAAYEAVVWRPEEDTPVETARSKIDVLRRQYKSVALGVMGRGRDSERSFEGEMAWDGQDTGLFALPADVSHLTRLQDPATGETSFTFDVSAFDGPDLWA